MTGVQFRVKNYVGLNTESDRHLGGPGGYPNS